MLIMLSAIRLAKMHLLAINYTMILFFLT